MIDALKPYPEYKDAGLPWVSCVPKHWAVPRLRQVFRMLNGATPRSGDESFWNGNIVWITPEDLGRLTQRDIVTSARHISEAGYRSCGTTLAPPNSLALSTRAPIGHVAITRVPACVNQGCRLLIPAPGEEAAFWCYQLDTIRDELQALGQGSTFSELSRSKLLSVPVLQPPPEEQAAIVRFLDHVDRRIRRYIRAKRQLIALLNEQKQAIIHRAVTRGFVDQLPLNELWLPREVRGQEGWNSCSVRHLIQRGCLAIQDGNHGELHPKAADYVDDGIPFLMASDVRADGLNTSGCAKICESQAMGLRIGFAKPGDILLTHKATIGQVGRVPEVIRWPFMMLTPQVTYYRVTGESISRDYLFLYMQSRQFQDQLDLLSVNQSTRRYIGIQEQRNLVICFPDSQTQLATVDACTSETTPIEAMIAKTTEEIDLFAEYRTLETVTQL